VSYTTPQLDAAAAVATLLTGRTIAGLVVSASASDLLPKYDLSDLSSLKVDSVPGPDGRFTRESRGMALEDCPVNIGIQKLCGPEDGDTYRQLLALLRGIAKVIAFEPAGDFGLPREDVEFADNADAVDEHGRFYGVVGAMYRVQTEAD
jgi:hypothetical protein